MNPQKATRQVFIKRLVHQPYCLSNHHSTNKGNQMNIFVQSVDTVAHLCPIYVQVRPKTTKQSIEIHVKHPREIKAQNL